MSDNEKKIEYMERELFSVLGGDIKPEKLVNTLHKGVIMMEDFIYTKGKDKKIILKTALERIIDKHIIEDEVKIKIDTILDNCLDEMIDSFVAMTKFVKKKIRRCSCIKLQEPHINK